jgi:hypothetical protein
MPLTKLDRALYRALLPLAAKLDVYPSVRLLLGESRALLEFLPATTATAGTPDPAATLLAAAEAETAPPSPLAAAALELHIAAPPAYPVDLTGGTGVRFRPLSQRHYLPPSPRSAVAALRTVFRRGPSDPADVDAAFAVLRHLTGRISFARRIGLLSPLAESRGGGAAAAVPTSPSTYSSSSSSSPPRPSPSTTGAYRDVRRAASLPFPGSLPLPDARTRLARRLEPGVLLLAHPFLLDYPFGRKVILVLDHSEDGGTVGVIVNQGEGECAFEDVASAFTRPMTKAADRAEPDDGDDADAWAPGRDGGAGSGRGGPRSGLLSYDEYAAFRDGKPVIRSLDVVVQQLLRRETREGGGGAAPGTLAEALVAATADLAAPGQLRTTTVDVHSGVVAFDTTKVGAVPLELPGRWLIAFGEALVGPATGGGGGGGGRAPSSSSPAVAGPSRPRTAATPSSASAPSPLHLAGGSAAPGASSSSSWEEEVDALDPVPDAVEMARVTSLCSRGGVSAATPTEALFLSLPLPDIEGVDCDTDRAAFAATPMHARRLDLHDDAEIATVLEGTFGDDLWSEGDVAEMLLGGAVGGAGKEALVAAVKAAAAAAAEEVEEEDDDEEEEDENGDAGAGLGTRKSRRRARRISPFRPASSSVDHVAAAELDSDDSDGIVVEGFSDADEDGSGDDGTATAAEIRRSARRELVGSPPTRDILSSLVEDTEPDDDGWEEFWSARPSVLARADAADVLLGVLRSRDIGAHALFGRPREAMGSGGVLGVPRLLIVGPFDDGTTTAATTTSAAAAAAASGPTSYGIIPLPLGPGLDMPASSRIRAAQDAFDVAAWERAPWRALPPALAEKILGAAFAQHAGSDADADDDDDDGEEGSGADEAEEVAGRGAAGAARRTEAGRGGHPMDGDAGPSSSSSAADTKQVVSATVSSPSFLDRLNAPDKEPAKSPAGAGGASGGKAAAPLRAAVWTAPGGAERRLVIGRRWNAEGASDDGGLAVVLPLPADEDDGEEVERGEGSFHPSPSSSRPTTAAPLPVPVPSPLEVVLFGGAACFADQPLLATEVSNLLCEAAAVVASASETGRLLSPHPRRGVRGQARHVRRTRRGLHPGRPRRRPLGPDHGPHAGRFRRGRRPRGRSRPRHTISGRRG